MTEIVTASLGECPEVLANVAYLAAKVGPTIIEHFGDEDRTGGYLFIASKAGETLLLMRVASPLPKRASLNLEYSKEEAERLGDHPEHLLSWQSRNPEKKQFGEAIRLPNGDILSFSGLPEEKDGPFCMSLARFTNLILPGHAVDMMRIAGEEEIFRQVFSLFGERARNS